jgi:site-specific DNA-cytosine methylase
MPDKDNLGAVLIPFRAGSIGGYMDGDAAGTIRAAGGDLGGGSENLSVMQPVAFRKSKRAQSATDDESWIPAEQANTLNQFDTGERDTHAVAFHPTQDPISSADGSTHCMGTGSGQGNATVAIAHAMTVRRLTPRECERLQGFPDDWTLIPWRKRDASDCPDGPRYKALGNSMAVNCMEWIGERIAAREAR